MSLADVVMPDPRLALDIHIQRSKRAYQRLLARRPTSFERQRMEQTARLVARAELAAIDPGISTDDLVRITNLARRAEASLFVLIGSPQRRPPADRVPAFNALDWLEAKERSAS